jgi:hypothetical protein
MLAYNTSESPDILSFVGAHHLPTALGPLDPYSQGMGCVGGVSRHGVCWWCVKAWGVLVVCQGMGCAVAPAAHASGTPTTQ